MAKYRNKASSSDNFRELFEGRTSYKEEVRHPGLIDTLYTNMYYGLLDEHYHPITPINTGDSTNLRILKPFSETVSCLNFVAEAFLNFRQEYVEFIESGRNQYPPFIESLIPKSGYEDFLELYQEYSTEVIDHYLSILLERKHEIYGLTDFFRIMKEIMNTSVKSRPISMSGFLLSGECTLMVSGLYISLSRNSADDDTNKSYMLNSPDTACYIHFANKNGFKIDKNSPWRLVADLESYQIKDKIRLYHNKPKVEDILNHYYRSKTHYDDIYSVQNILLRIYNKFASENPVLTSIEYNGSLGMTEMRSFILPSLNESDLDLGIGFWIELVSFVRMKEVGIPSEKIFLNTQKILDYHDVYSVQYSRFDKNLLKPSMGLLGDICGKEIKRLFENKKEVNTDERLYLDDYGLKKSKGLKESKMEIKRRKIISGRTSIDHGHDHIYKVDQNGNGIALDAFHPENPDIFHSHRIVNWRVESEASNCYPHCMDLYQDISTPGAPLHIHRLIIDDESN